MTSTVSGFRCTNPTSASMTAIRYFIVRFSSYSPTKVGKIMRISINVVILVPESKNHHTTMITPLTAISPVDGRYRNKTEKLADYFSEAALIRYRIRVEVEYFIALCELPLPQLEGIDHARFADLRRLYTDFSEADALRVKEIESVTNHDVKAVEYIIKEKMDALGLSAYKEFVHFGLTSQDINNTSIPLSLKEALTGVYYPAVEEVRDKLAAFAREWHDVPMLARTHGQPASPTTLGKEFMVFVERLEKQLAMLHAIAIPAKFGGATGNFNAHHAAYPSIDWVAFANRFVGDTLGLSRSQYTTRRSNTTTTWRRSSTA